jgi:excisionase family DNA binding protein
VSPAVLKALEAVEAAIASARAAIESAQATVASVKAHAEHPAADQDEDVPLRATGYSPRTLRRAIAAGELEASLVGRELRIRRRALEAWIAKKRVTPRETPPREKTLAERAIERGVRNGTLRYVAGGGAR